MRAMAQTLADRGALKPDLTPSEAADIGAGRSMILACAGRLPDI
jgi:hypothetical protein